MGSRELRLAALRLEGSLVDFLLAAGDDIWPQDKQKLEAALDVARKETKR